MYVCRARPSWPLLFATLHQMDATALIIMVLLWHPVVHQQWRQDPGACSPRAHAGRQLRVLSSYRDGPLVKCCGRCG